MVKLLNQEVLCNPYIVVAQLLESVFCQEVQEHLQKFHKNPWVTGTAYEKGANDYIRFSFVSIALYLEDYFHSDNVNFILWLSL